MMALFTARDTFGIMRLIISIFAAISFSAIISKILLAPSNVDFEFGHMRDKLRAAVPKLPFAMIIYKLHCCWLSCHS